MPDDIDLIQEKQQIILEAQIAKTRAAAQAAKHAPFCRLCGEPIPPARQSDICVDCAEEIERQQKQRRRRG